MREGRRVGEGNVEEGRGISGLQVQRVNEREEGEGRRVREEGEGRRVRKEGEGRRVREGG